mmetsp:Transcript_6182/g.17165  ORF Transcript_6182/g.17165 Transcript_6182/m.17165 type:complete len:351 (-) Transcript_6182:67-1119(-)|eukprot:CAMPEP_0177320704 /NCGR_PEP_ID=MMETSP0368-20130122/15276_1 /TAXON_ID=447022 ORGANISM="Scrippsiella hangoei-like, Strain SHHI-4" /NCGR_SAMPLE_ID=MMETSP0368 /ASSEMBLY_ACC=CAM_ASM_000363 /LENGTH=350 /DNA_ID=CAMNT_0018780271 /DNA_START=54 /DNA_END=1106 /DNA_ORIENTATION=-
MPVISVAVGSLGIVVSAGAILAAILRASAQRKLSREAEQVLKPEAANGELVARAEVQAPREARRSADELLQEVAQKSKAVLYVVSNKTSDKFSLPNLTKYLRMKGVEVFEGSTPEDTIEVNALRLLQLLDSTASGPGSKPRAAPGAPLHHELIEEGVARADLDARFPAMKDAYVQQPLDYGRNSRYGDKWRISCYLVVMENWKPKIEAHPAMVECMGPVMDKCTDAFARWYCGIKSLASIDVSVMNAFVTRYRPVHEEDQLKKHIDGSNVDGSVILALPTDDPFEGGELYVWDGKPQKEYVYRMNPGDLLFLDNAVWHQAKPITSGTRWALVLFLRLQSPIAHGSCRPAG